MPLSVRFSFFGEQQIERTLAGVAERSRDLTPAWDELERRFVDYEAEWFASEGEGSWPPLSKSYAEWKARHFPGRPILQLTGELLQSVTKPDIAVKEPRYAIFGTGDPVARYHQRGDGNLPIRRVIDLDDQERREWVRVVQRHIMAEGTGTDG